MRFKIRIVWRYLTYFHLPANMTIILNKNFSIEGEKIIYEKKQNRN